MYMYVACSIYVCLYANSSQSSECCIAQFGMGTVDDWDNWRQFNFLFGEQQTKYGQLLPKKSVKMADLKPSLSVVEFIAEMMPKRDAKIQISLPPSLKEILYKNLAEASGCTTS